jgi:hypothetical protein
VTVAANRYRSPATRPARTVVASVVGSASARRSQARGGYQSSIRSLAGKPELRTMGESQTLFPTVVPLE